MSFFDEPGSSPPDAEPPSYRTPEWLAPPPNVIPATVALDVVLVHRPDHVIWISDALVYPSGLSFGVNVQRRDPAREPVPLFFGSSDADGLRFGLLLADGRKVLVQALGRPFLQRPDRPILRPRSGGSGGGRERAEMWLWPLPPPGPLTFVCTWPAMGIAEVSTAIDAGPVLAAAARAVEMWPDERPLPPSEDDVVI